MLILKIQDLPTPINLLFNKLKLKLDSFAMFKLSPFLYTILFGKNSAQVKTFDTEICYYNRKLNQVKKPKYLQRLVTANASTLRYFSRKPTKYCAV